MASATLAPRSEAFEVLGQGTDGALALGPVQQGRDRRHPDAVAAERLHFEAEPREVVGMRGQRVAGARREGEQQRLQETLRLERLAGQPLGELLVEDALVRDVLIDDQHPVVVDGDSFDRPRRRHREQPAAGRGTPVSSETPSRPGICCHQLIRVPPAPWPKTTGRRSPCTAAPRRPAVRSGRRRIASCHGPSSGVYCIAAGLNRAAETVPAPPIHSPDCTPQ